MPVINETEIKSYHSTNQRFMGGALDYSYKVSIPRTWTNTRITSSNPNWRQTIREHKNATSPYFRTSRNFFGVNVVGYGKFFDPSKDGGKIAEYYVNQFDFGPAAGDPTGLSTAKADLLARQKFIQEYRDRRTGFQTGVFLGELMETVRMIASPAKKLREEINRYHWDVKRRLRRSKNRHRTVQDTWLEYQFGWTPLINDVADAISLVSKEPTFVFVRLSGSGKDDQTAPDDTVLTASPDTIGGPMAWTERYRTSNVVRVKYGGAIAWQNQLIPGFAEQIGLSWSNVLPTAWELIPYSFLVDYFTNVGKVIDGVSTGVVSLAWGYKNVKKVAEVHRTTVPRFDLWTSNYGSRQHTGYVTGDGLMERFTYFSREPIEQVYVGIRDLTFKLPGSDTRWLNIAALAKLRK